MSVFRSAFDLSFKVPFIKICEEILTGRKPGFSYWKPPIIKPLNVLNSCVSCSTLHLVLSVCPVSELLQPRTKLPFNRRKLKNNSLLHSKIEKNTTEITTNHRGTRLVKTDTDYKRRTWKLSAKRFKMVLRTRIVCTCFTIQFYHLTATPLKSRERK